MIDYTFILYVLGMAQTMIAFDLMYKDDQNRNMIREAIIVVFWPFFSVLFLFGWIMFKFYEYLLKK